MIVLGIDAGTTATKVLAVNDKGKIVGRGSYEYSLQSKSGGIVEQDADDWIKAVAAAVSQALCDIPDRGEIRALALSTQGATMTAVDNNFTPLCPAITWMDGRAADEAELLAGRVGEENIYRKCGWEPGACYDISKIMWLKKNRPDIYSRTTCFVSTIEYINRFLTGRAAADPTNAAIRGMYNIVLQKWDGEILAAAETDEKLLPEVLPTGALVGTLTAEASEALGLDRNVKVYNGAHDQYCAALGCGALERGDMLLSCGTTWVVLGVTDKPVFTESRISPGLHPRAGLYGAMASLTTAGSALKWLRELTGGDSYENIDKNAAARRENAFELYFMPYIAGAGFPEPMRKMGGCAVGLRLHHDKYDLALALMEGVAFETKNALAEFERASIKVERLRMVGGAAKSELWRALVGCITGCEIIKMEETEGCALGAAMIAAVGSGIFDSYGSASAAMVSATAGIYSDGGTAEYYKNKFNKYNALSKALRGVIKAW